MTDERRDEPRAPEGATPPASSSLLPPPPARRASVRRPRPPRRRRRRWPYYAALALLVGAGGWWWFSRGGNEDGALDFGDVSGDVAVERQAGGDRSVVLVFPEWDGRGYVTEQRQIPSRDRPGEDLLALMRGLCDGPQISGAVSPIPRGTSAVAAFVDPDTRAVVLDFSRELVTRHPGGSAAEVATLTAILRTVALNFPDTARSCVILVEGAQVETLAGHLDLVRPFDPRRWL